MKNKLKQKLNIKDKYDLIAFLMGFGGALLATIFIILILAGVIE